MRKIYEHIYMWNGLWRVKVAESMILCSVLLFIRMVWLIDIMWMFIVIVIVIVVGDLVAAAVAAIHPAYLFFSNCSHQRGIKTIALKKKHIYTIYNRSRVARIKKGKFIWIIMKINSKSIFVKSFREFVCRFT